MFIRKTIKKDKNTKKIYHSYQLVEAYRTDRGPRQHILLTITYNQSLSKEERKLLANRIEELASSVQSLLAYPDHIETLAQAFARQLTENVPVKRASDKKENSESENSEKNKTDYETVDLNSVEHINCRTVGLEHICLETIQKLQLDQKLKEFGFTQKEVTTAIGSIIGRLVSARSERAMHFWLQNNTALDELIGADFSKLSLGQCYQISDKLLNKKDEIEKHLAFIEKDIFNLDNAIVLYDLTNTYLEGTGCNSNKSKRGRSKEKRTDCPLISLGLVLNEDGFPYKSHIYEGNISEPQTLQKIITELSQSNNKTSVIVLDAGIASQENLEFLRMQNRPYIVCSRTRSNPPESLKDNFDFIEKKNNNIVKAVLVDKSNDSGEVELFCHSTAREEKETAIKSLFQVRFEKQLIKLNEGLNKKRGIKKIEKVIEKIGRLKEKYSRVARFYTINVERLENTTNVKKVTFILNNEAINDRYNGVYCLKCWGLDWKAEKLWKTYRMLTKVEEGFRCLKSELGLRPIYHQIDDRIDGHLFITLLAYHVMQSVLYQLNNRGINIRWQTLRDIMSTHTRVTSSFKNKKGETINVRSSTIPGLRQNKIYKALQIISQPGRRIKSKI